MKWNRVNVHVDKKRLIIMNPITEVEIGNTLLTF